MSIFANVVCTVIHIYLIVLLCFYFIFILAVCVYAT
jgi:hypothetical protein